MTWHNFSQLFASRIHLICNSVSFRNPKYAISSFSKSRNKKVFFHPPPNYSYSHIFGIFDEKGTFPSQECFKRLWRKRFSHYGPFRFIVSFFQVDLFCIIKNILVVGMSLRNILALSGCGRVLPPALLWRFSPNSKMRSHDVISLMHCLASPKIVAESRCHQGALGATCIYLLFLEYSTLCY